MYFVVDPDREVAPQRAAFVWQRLWEMRDLVPIAAMTPAVVSSPWDVFPRGEPADFAWMNLLPVIRKAHSVSLQREVDISCWDARDFRAFHQRVSAILRSASDTPLVARQV
jgi:hypothetical protein